MSSDLPSKPRMVEALVEAAMRDALTRQVTINNVAGFKHTVEQRLRDGEATHPGYIAIAYRALTGPKPSDPPLPPTPDWRYEPVPDAIPPTELEQRARAMAARLRGQIPNTVPDAEEWMP